MDDFLRKLKKVVRIVLYGPAVSQSDYRKAGLYQLPSNNILYLFKFHECSRSTFRIVTFSRCSLHFHISLENGSQS